MLLSVILFVPTRMQSFIRPRHAAGGKSLLPTAQQKDMPESHRPTRKKKFPSLRKNYILQTHIARPTKTKAFPSDKSVTTVACNTVDITANDNTTAYNIKLPTIFFCGADEHNESVCKKFTFVLGDIDEHLIPAKKYCGNS